MSDRDAFWNAICAEPDDDAPRLVFADWLDDHGESAQAEFIRVQCALAHLTEADAEYWTLGDRERDLLAEHGEAWRQPLPDGFHHAGFRRGFPALGGSSEAFLAHAEHIAAGPPVESVHLTIRTRDQKSLADCPAFSRVGMVTLSPRQHAFGPMFEIVQSPYLSHIHNVTFGNVLFMRDDVRQFATWPGLRQFYRLGSNADSYQRCFIGDSAGLALATSPHLSRLWRLVCSGDWSAHVHDALRERFGDRREADIPF